MGQDSATCRGTKMKRLIALILLLLAPVVASAQCPPGPSYQCQVAPYFYSGTLTWTSAAVWDASTPSDYKTVWTTTGSAVDVSDPTGLGVGHGIGPPIPSGGEFRYIFSTRDPANLSMTLAIDNVLLPQDPSGSAFVSIDIEGPTITHAGTYPVIFGWGGEFESCRFCTLWILSNAGIGSGVIDVVPYPGRPNTFYVDQANLTFGFGAPEPSAASLLLLGFAGLAILGWRRRSRATLIQTG
jgi:PEP-CTERM motif